MLVSELPFEILLRVAEHLSKSDKTSCASVCKRWTPPFQESLWKNIKAKSLKDIDRFYNLSKHSTNKFPYTLNRSLIIGGKSTFTDWLKCCIFQTFPNLMHLDILSMRMENKDVHESEYCGPIKSLVSLHLKFSTMGKPMVTPKIIRFIAQFPSLEKLNIHSYGPYYSMPLTTSDINTIHQNSPQLKSIKGYISLDNIDQDSVKTIPNTMPVPLVKALDLLITSQSCLWSHYLWLCYFRYKYPKLRSLKLNIVCKEGGFSFKEYNKRNGSFSSSATPVFLLLETVQFHINDKRKIPNAFLWDIIQQSSTSIKRLKYKTFSNTRKTAPIEEAEPFNINNIIIPNFSRYPLLVDLDIEYSNISIALDDLLDNCRALRHLYLSKVQLCTSRHAHNNPIQHALQTCDLEDIIIKTSVFNYISFRCRSLDLIKLTRLKICGSISKETGGMDIDMSYTRIKMLIIDRIKFYSSSNNINDSTKVNLFLLSHLPETSQPNENIKMKNVESPMSFIRWFHSIKNDEQSHNFKQDSRELSDQDGQEVLDYYHKHSYTKVSNGQEQKKYFERSLKDYWEKDLCRGYAEFRCGYIAKYVIPQLW
ncbi:hypothetical protein J3Q64DRAFT_1747668 [Phycomyces blakesleeanus]|uniref:F-box domain-containing protein n=2 Tax=Phycomyces blakesleeanus TaxID=4837 RepID=A0A163ACB5_PHYB8|nr:hypothetical protein PHYBLDRAFT_159168 [Phycomyces blakesleeanus NRRL 1555(-)]OAD72531.1 hypothetical protein PHYBLDRAFT_159168 [Phycomyces blakesleeanus NRRL 1555(-)]|eukprot:XP_018290571.1 hypothetical protein PHYBLDRAFT_159168 [Phycomyces blakesleeanus NRRL 1555(-)]